MESEICWGGSGAGQLLNWGSRTTDPEWMRVVEWGTKRVKLWMTMPSPVGGLGEEWPCTMICASGRDLVYHVAPSIHCSTFREGPEAANLY